VVADGLLYLPHEHDGEPLHRARSYVTDAAVQALRTAGLLTDRDLTR